MMHGTMSLKSSERLYAVEAIEVVVRNVLYQVLYMQQINPAGTSEV